MRRGGIFLSLSAGLVIGLTGCILTEPMRPVVRYAKDVFGSGGNDYADPTEEEDAAWITEMAEEGRPDQPRVKDPDQWWRKYIMSEKARSIEHNLGFD